MKFTVAVTQIVEVELHAKHFDRKFIAEFCKNFYPYKTLQDHAKHIAQLHARGLYGGSGRGEFIEGYGPDDEMGIKARIVEQEEEIQ